MWCKSCRQDVPGLISPGEKCYCCARCGSVVDAGAASGDIEFQPANDPNPDAFASDRSEPAELLTTRYDPWELNEKLRHIGSRLRPEHIGRLSDADSILRRDWGRPLAADREMEQWPGALAAVSWLLAAIGLGTFACGVALLAFGLSGGQSELWQLGLPIVLVGQLAWLAAIVANLAGRRMARRAAGDPVEQFDQHLETIRRRLATSATRAGARARTTSHRPDEG